jgi:hypothetical protein
VPDAVDSDLSEALGSAAGTLAGVTNRVETPAAGTAETVETEGAGEAGRTVFASSGAAPSFEGVESRVTYVELTLLSRGADEVSRSVDLC